MDIANGFLTGVSNGGSFYWPFFVLLMSIMGLGFFTWLVWGRLDFLETRVGKVEESVIRLEGRVDRLQSTMEERFNTMEEKFNTMEEKFNTMEEKINGLRDMMFLFIQSQSPNRRGDRPLPQGARDEVKRPIGVGVP